MPLPPASPFPVRASAGRPPQHPAFPTSGGAQEGLLGRWPGSPQASSCGSQGRCPPNSAAHRTAGFPASGPASSPGDLTSVLSHPAVGPGFQAGKRSGPPCRREPGVSQHVGWRARGGVGCDGGSRALRPAPTASLRACWGRRWGPWYWPLSPPCASAHSVGGHFQRPRSATLTLAAAGERWHKRPFVSEPSRQGGACWPLGARPSPPRPTSQPARGPHRALDGLSFLPRETAQQPPLEAARRPRGQSLRTGEPGPLAGGMGRAEPGLRGPCVCMCVHRALCTPGRTCPARRRRRPRGHATPAPRPHPVLVPTRAGSLPGQAAPSPSPGLQPLRALVLHTEPQLRPGAGVRGHRCPPPRES